MKTIKSFRISEANNKRLVEIVEKHGLTEGWIINRLLDNGLDGLAKMLDGSKSHKKPSPE